MARSASHAVVHQLKNVDEYEWALRCIEKFPVASSQMDICDRCTRH